MAKFTTLTSHAVPLPEENVDTDQIIPARFLKVTDKNGLGDSLFCDWRYLKDGSPNPDFVLESMPLGRLSDGAFERSSRRVSRTSSRATR